MLLQANDPRLKNLRAANWIVPYELQLPDLRELQETHRNVPQADGVAADYPLRALTILEASQQQALGGLIQSIGVPTLRIFNDVVSTFKIDVVGDITERLLAAYDSIRAATKAMEESPEGGEAMRVAAEGATAHAINLTASIPAVGFAVRLAWSVGKMIQRIAKLASDDYGAAERIFAPTRFNPTYDIDVLNNILEDVRVSSDWSGVFGPPRLGQNIGTLPDYTVSRTTVGVEIQRATGYGDNGLPINWSDAGYHGMIPGTATLHAGVSVEKGVASDIGSTLFPSARNLGATLWSQVAAPGSGALSPIFTVNASRVAGWWQDYIFGLHVFVHETGDLASHEKTSIIKRMNGDESGPIFGWGKSLEPQPNEWDEYQATRVCQTLRDRQFKACDTLLIAYVDEGFGAFSDTALRDRFRKRRMDLLQHPAVCDVRLNDVVEPAYRDALESAGAGSGRCQQIEPWFTAAPGTGTFEPEDDTGDGGQGGLGGLGEPPPTGGKRSSVLPALLGLGGLGALAYIASRKR